MVKHPSHLYGTNPSPTTHSCGIMGLPMIKWQRGQQSGPHSQINWRDLFMLALLDNCYRLGSFKDSSKGHGEGSNPSKITFGSSLCMEGKVDWALGSWAEWMVWLFSQDSGERQLEDKTQWNLRKMHVIGSLGVGTRCAFVFILC